MLAFGASPGGSLLRLGTKHARWPHAHAGSVDLRWVLLVLGQLAWSGTGQRFTCMCDLAYHTPCLKADSSSGWAARMLVDFGQNLCYPYIAQNQPKIRSLSSTRLSILGGGRMLELFTHV